MIARKEGRIVTVFMDGDSVVPFTDFNNPPMGFPLAMTEEQARAKWPGMKFLERPKENENRVGKVIPDARIAEVTGKPVDRLPDSDFLKERRVDVGEKGLAVVGLKGQAELSEVFTDMLREYHVASGRQKKEIERDIEAVGSFLLRVSPSWAEELQRLKEAAAPKVRFKL